jgi:L-alanine-DL-glutamate epimerase-like enolase superfamily enzyme
MTFTPIGIGPAAPTQRRHAPSRSSATRPTSTFNLRLAPHLWAGAPCFFAGLHVCAASPASFTIEYSLGANPMIHDLVEETVRPQDGMIAIPDSPGLGFTIREGFLQAHAQGARS